MSWEHFPEVDSRMDEVFMQKLITIRKELNRPMIVSSSYRSVEDEIRHKRSGKSAHCTGHAVDVLISGEDALLLIHLAVKHEMTGIGVSQTGEDRFIHIDDLTGNPHQPRPWIWSY